MNDQQKTNSLLIPYKPTYGFPKHCNNLNSLSTTSFTKNNINDKNDNFNNNNHNNSKNRIKYNEIKSEYEQCQLQSINDWSMKDLKYYYTESENFCCFVEQVLLCEKTILSKCDEIFSKLNQEKTKQLFYESCTKFDCSNSNSNKVLKISLSITSVIILIILISVCCFYRKKLMNICHSKNDINNDQFRQARQNYLNEKFQILYNESKQDLIDKKFEYKAKLLEKHSQKQQLNQQQIINGSNINNNTINNNVVIDSKCRIFMNRIGEKSSNFYRKIMIKIKLCRLKKRTRNIIKEQKNNEEFWIEFEKNIEHYGFDGKVRQGIDNIDNYNNIDDNNTKTSLTLCQKMKNCFNKLFRKNVNQENIDIENTEQQQQQLPSVDDENNSNIDIDNNQIDQLNNENITKPEEGQQKSGFLWNIFSGIIPSSSSSTSSPANQQQQTIKNETKIANSNNDNNTNKIIESVSIAASSTTNNQLESITK